MKPAFACILPIGLLLGLPAYAQGASADLPPACAVKTAPSGGHTMSSGMNMGAAPAGPGHSDGAHVDAGHQALMDSMKGMAGMDNAMMAPDLDVAFVCGMIPHHRAAIAMARAELAHGDDPWARKLAEEIIAAQEKEIAAMTAWLDKQPR